MLKRLCYFSLGSLIGAAPILIALLYGWQPEGVMLWIVRFIPILGGIATLAVAERKNKVRTLDQLHRPQTLFND